MASAGALERGRVKARLIRLLATGEHDQPQLAAQFGVTQPSISRFATRHAAEIESIRARLDDEFVQLWIAAKADRLAEYQQDVEDVEELLGDPDRAARAGVQWAEMKRVKQSALKSAAEELGQLPNRQTLQHEGGVSVRYEVVGVNTGDLT